MCGGHGGCEAHPAERWAVRGALHFPGALPEGQIRRLLEKHGVAPGDAETSWSEDPAERLSQLRAAVAVHPERDVLKLELALALVATTAFEEAARLLESLPPPLYTDPRAAHARAQVVLNRMAFDERFAAVAPGVRAILDGERETRVEQLLEILREQKHDEHSPAKSALVEVTHLLEDEDQLRALRRRMASILF